MSAKTRALPCLRTTSFLFPAILLALLASAFAQSRAAASFPWMNPKLSPDERATMVVQRMTLDEKITLLHGTGMKGLGPVSPLSAGSNGGAGYVVGIPRLGIPGIQMSDAAYGVRMSGDNGRYSTALPNNLASAASWDLNAAYEYGALIGSELRAQGYNMSLGGGVNLTREPRNGRTFEYLGEDPILAGKMVGQVMRGLQAQHVIGDIKHYALNDQESGRNSVNVNIDKRSMRESDLLAFEIGVHEGDIAAVMCSYNRINGDYACENKYLLTDVLKKDWHFPGFVVSDWGATHSAAKASAAGLDQEEPAEIFYGAPMKKAVQSGQVPMGHPHTIVVLESGSPVTMPWADKVPGIVEAWYPGIRGAEAVANTLFGEVNPSAKLPITFPRSDADLPHPKIIEPPAASVSGDWKKIAAGLPAFQIRYDEGLKVGYKWYDAEHKPVLFPFGYGLSYTTYTYSDLKVTPGTPLRVSFTLANTGSRPGAEIAEVYASLPDGSGEPPKRLVGWAKVKLNAGESKPVELEIDLLYLTWNRTAGSWCPASTS